MPTNRNALVRYKTIDNCLQNRFRKWTLEDLIDACSDALYEYEGIDKGVSKRTIQGDIQLMRSDKLGYNAPIIVLDKKYYTYEEKDYSITNIPITDQDLEKLNETVEFLKQFKGFSHFRELDGMVQKLEDHVYSQKTNQNPVIDFEKNENLKGLEFLDILYKSIIQKKTISLTYQSFKARFPNTFDIYPYLLKEFRNRWFIIGCKQKGEMLYTLALDRIISVNQSDTLFKYKDDFNANEYFKSAIGVSVSPYLNAEKVVLIINHKHAPYVLTKPLHSSQKLIEKDNFGVTISLDVQLNFELEKDILGLGEAVKVIAPERLKRNIKRRLNDALDLYHSDLNSKGLQVIKKQVENRGFSSINFMYTNREIKKIKRFIYLYYTENEIKTQYVSDVLGEIPKIKEFVENKNLSNLIAKLNPSIKLKNCTYFDHPRHIENYLAWKQDTKLINYGTSETELDSKLKNSLSIYIYLDEFKPELNKLQVVLGSQNKLFSQTEIETITNNCTPSSKNINIGGIAIVKPLLLQRFSASTVGTKRYALLKLDFV